MFGVRFLESWLEVDFGSDLHVPWVVPCSDCTEVRVSHIRVDPAVGNRDRAAGLLDSRAAGDPD